MTIMAQPGEGLTPQPGGPEVVPVASLRLKEHYRGLLTGLRLSTQLCYPARLRAPLSRRLPALLSRSPPGARSRRLPSSLVASSSLVSPDADAPFGSRGSRKLLTSQSRRRRRPSARGGATQHPHHPPSAS